MDDRYQSILKKIDESREHILFREKKQRYYNDFTNILQKVSLSGRIKSKREYNAFINKLQLNKKYDRYTFYQGVSEIIFWVYFIQNNYNFEIEKKVSSDNKTDIDFQVINEQFKFNIEVKCPEFFIPGDGELIYQNAFRTVEKDISMDMINAFEVDILKLNFEKIKPQYSKLTKIKTSDNKMVDYLKSSQKKFSDSCNNSLNVLIVAVRSQDIQSYWEYLYNGFSGLFTDNSFNDCREFNKVDVVLLSNLVDGHLRPNAEYNSWDISNYCNILCMNPNSNKKISGNYTHEFQKLYDLFPNSTKEFEDYYLKFFNIIREQACDSFILEPLLFPHYMKQHHPLQWNNV